MRYQFIGLPVPYKGKPIWEIVGNLKNFGVGRLIVADEHKDQFVAPTFYKIVRVQPLSESKEIGVYRKVFVWAEHVMRGKKLSQLEQIQKDSVLTKYHLVPKEEEAKYFSGITDNPEMTVLARYQPCPPLYKKVLELRNAKLKSPLKSIPKVETMADTGEKSFQVISTEDIEEAPIHSDLYKTDVPVEELYKRICLLRKKLGIVVTKDEEND